MTQDFVVLFLLLLVAVFPGVNPQVLPGGLVGRWSALNLAAVSNLASWPEFYGNTQYNAYQANTAYQPIVTSKAIYCKNAVKLRAGSPTNGASYMEIPFDPIFNHDISKGLTIMVLARQDNSKSGRIFSKGLSTYYELSFGAAGGNTLARIFANSVFTSGGAIGSASAYLPHTDLQSFYVWSAVVDKGKCIEGYQDGQANFLSPDGNFNSPGKCFAGASITNVDNPRIGNSLSTDSTSATILEVLFYDRDLTPTEVQDATNALLDTWHLRCPTLFSENARHDSIPAKSTCENAKTGQECAQICEAGFYPLFGTPDHTCGTGEWMGSPLVCQPMCPPSFAPANTGSCIRRQYTLPDLSTLTSSFLDDTWQVEPLVPRTERDTYWRAVSNVGLVTSASTAPCNVALPSYLTLANPYWLYSLTTNMELKYTVTMTLDAGEMGVVFRYRDKQNLYALILKDGSTTPIRLIKVVEGVKTTLFTSPTSILLSTSYTITVTARGSDFSFEIRNTSTNTLVVIHTFQDASHVYGTLGLVSNGDGTVVAATVHTDCDTGGNCLGAFEGTKCIRSCAPGYTPVGSAEATCVSDGSGGVEWDTVANLECVIDPPVFDPTAPRQVPENSPQDTVVGDPINAEAQASNVVVLYSIDSVTPTPSGPAGVDLFLIHPCSGQITVGAVNKDTGPWLDYEDVNTYSVTVRATSSSSSISFNTEVFDIQIVDVNEKPVFPTTQLVFHLPENSVYGTSVGDPIVWTDPDSNPLFRQNVFRIDSDDSNGLFAIETTTPETGIIKTRSTNPRVELNYEGAKKTFRLRIVVEDSTNPSLFSTVSVIIHLTDENDPPVVTPSQILLETDEHVLDGAPPFPTSVAFFDEDVGQTHTHTITGGPDAALFKVLATTNQIAWNDGVDPADHLQPLPYIFDNRLLRAHFTITVRVTDNGTPAMWDEQTVTLYVLSSSTTVTDKPTVTGVNGNFTVLYVNTTGGGIFTIKGYNFHTYSNHVPKVAFTGPAIGSNPAPVVLALDCLADTDTEITCQSTEPGTGTQYAMSVVFYKDNWQPVVAALDTLVLLHFNPPVGTGQTGGSEYDNGDYTWLMSTAGGTEIELQGNNFGTSCANVKVLFGPIDNPIFTGVCLTVDHTAITFSASIGLGFNLQIVVTVGGQSTIFTAPGSLIGYKAPTITAITIPAGQTPSYTPSTFPTVAGLPFLIHGANFGPSTVKGVAYPVQVFLENDFGSFAATCTRDPATPHTRLQCSSPGTYGPTLYPRVVVAEQISTMDEYACDDHVHCTISHPIPVLNNVLLSVPSLNTAGGQAIIIDGTNLGPLGLTYASHEPTRLSVRYGKIPESEDDDEDELPFDTRYPILAKSCIVTVATITHHRVECVSAPGTGVGLDLAILVGGREASPLFDVLAYSAPVIASFQGPGATAAATAGSQVVTIIGHNFGPSIGLIQASYMMELANNSSVPPEARVIDPRTADQTQWTFTPASCTLVIPHTRLDCLTAPGAGTALHWSLVVDGLPSRTPTTDYGRPSYQYLTLGNYHGETGAVPATNIDPFHGDVVYLVGTNFGTPTEDPTDPAFLEWVRYRDDTSEPVYLPASAITLESHDRMKINVPSGFGTGFFFEISVGGQISLPNTVRWGYKVPALVAVTPTTGSTSGENIVSGVPVRVALKIQAKNLPWHLPNIVYTMQWGNYQDNTYGLTPYMNIPCSKEPTVPCAPHTDCIQTLSCPLPAGNGLKRKIQIRIRRPGSGGSSELAYLVPNALYFNYRDPTIQYITAATVSTTPELLEQAVMAWGTAALPYVRGLYFHGRNFGAQVPGDSIRRLLEIRNDIDPDDPISFVPASPPGTVSSDQLTQLVYWTDTKVAFVTRVTQGTGRLRIVSCEGTLAMDTPCVEAEQISGEFDIHDHIPELTAIFPPTQNLPPGGSHRLKLSVPYKVFTSGVEMRVVVGEKLPVPSEKQPYCRVLDFAADGTTPTVTELPDDQVILRMREACEIVTESPVPETPCTMFCLLDPVRGGLEVPVTLWKDGVVSNAVLISFAAPVIQVANVTQTTTGWFQVYEVNNPSPVTVFSPTSGAELVLKGSNFGACPKITIGNGHEIDTCVYVEDPAEQWRVSDTLITVDVPPGTGRQGIDSFMNPFNFTLVLEAAEQANHQHSNVPIPFSYFPPEITSITPTEAPTTGSLPFRVTGKNFGPADLVPAPVVEIRFVHPASGTYFLCTDLEHVSDEELKCTLPPGVGNNLHVVVVVSGLSSAKSVDHVFSYFRPEIHSVQYEVWDEDLYNDWPYVWNNARGTVAFSQTLQLITGSGDPAAIGAWPKLPPAGRVMMTLTGKHFGPSGTLPRTCLLVTTNLAHKDCTAPELSDTPYCRCFEARKAGDVARLAQCNSSWLNFVGSVPSSIKPWETWGMPVCDGKFTFPGEGEVYNDGGAALAEAGSVHALQSKNAFGAGLILSWTQTEIKFLLPPGAGMSVLTVSVGGQLPLLSHECLLEYYAPVVTDVRKASRAVMTGPGSNDILWLRGRHFGHSLPLRRPHTLPDKYNSVIYFTDAYGNLITIVNDLSEDEIEMLEATPGVLEAYSHLIEAPLSEITEALALPGAFTTLRWSKVCLSSATLYTSTLILDTANALQPISCAQNKNETIFTILRHEQSSLYLRSHPGAGLDRVGEFVTHNTFTRFASSTFQFSYDAPLPFALHPDTIYIPSSSRLSLTGLNFGDPTDSSTADPEFLHMALVVEGTHAENVQRTPLLSSQTIALRDNPLKAIPVSVTGIFANLTVGRKDLEVQVMGQSGMLFRNQTRYPLYSVCSVGYFGRIGEYCLECPRNAYCAGYVQILEPDYDDVEEVDPEDEDDVDPEDLEDVTYASGWGSVAASARRRLSPHSRARRLQHTPSNTTIDPNAPHSYPRPLPGYYNLNTTVADAALVAEICPPAVRALYPDRDVCIVGCLPAEACAGDNFCAEGYASNPPYFRCGSCDTGFYKRSNNCVRCPDNQYALLIGFLVILAAVMVIGWLFNKYAINIAFTTIAIDYFQVLSMFANTSVAWPDQLKEILSVLSAFNLNIEIVAPECFIPEVSFKNKWLAIFITPLCIAVIFLVVYAFVYAFKRFFFGQTRKETLTGHKTPLISIFLVFSYIAYLYLTRTMLEIFNCVETSPPDGNLYLSAVFEPCNVPGGTQRTLLPFAIIGLFIYTIGYPVVIAYFLRKYRWEMMLDQLLRANNTGKSRLSNPKAFDIRLMFGRIYYQFKPDYYWWNIIIIFRKFGIAFISLMFRSSPGFQLATALLILFAAYVLQVKFQPFMSPQNRHKVLANHQRKSQEDPNSVHASLAAALKTVASADRKKTSRIDWHAPVLTTTRQILTTTSNIVFTPNTVETIVLACAILVSLAGVMFDALSIRPSTLNSYTSSNLVDAPLTATCADEYKNYCEGLNWAVVIIILISVVYLAATACVEIHQSLQSNREVEISIAKRKSMRLQKGQGGGSKRDTDSRAFLSARQLHADLGSLPPLRTETSVMDTSANPMFTLGDPTTDAELLDAEYVGSLTMPPTHAQWGVIRDAYTLMAKHNEDNLQQIAELKQQLEQVEALLPQENAHVNRQSQRKLMSAMMNVRGNAGGRKQFLPVNSSRVDGEGLFSNSAGIAASNPLHVGGRSARTLHLSSTLPEEEDHPNMATDPDSSVSVHSAGPMDIELPLFRKPKDPKPLKSYAPAESPTLAPPPAPEPVIVPVRASVTLNPLNGSLAQLRKDIHKADQIDEEGQNGRDEK